MHSFAPFAEDSGNTAPGFSTIVRRAAGSEFLAGRPHCVVPDGSLAT
eukprot:CAMPEP_0182942150 /NCGR_PEP_ID=MMETSP0105_2-20130417/50148_1 /TAXON_ID=81532 ORGANISM="Acanthoeca-like sp., Strain 10tr" /NCGR_SAMPLE_ID=MMETSP0105_2 /ASSEMBLY_ACC=CAM_ASM_000205 /LENGTH=46 /DNA_ID= /DNA_START= /DNA_END= /DNA_ORIENTATION=